ncbi:MAG TPA: UDP-N-acetylmuramoyl-L-alanyl-D-glutamate--2,6-diaminopimelate ligase [Patescibacteria group bacterium]
MKKILKSILRNRISPTTIKSLRKIESTLMASQYGFPAKKLRIIGVTGTNGKTSTCHYITQLLEESGHKVGMLTTVAISINGKRELNKTKKTTLDTRELHMHLKKFVDAGCEYAVVETTSHALDQNRVYGIYYEAVGFTNLTHEHLDYHKTMGEYQKAKEKLFANNPKVSVVNADDPAAKTFLSYPASKKFTYGILDPLRPKEALKDPDITASWLKMGSTTTSFKLVTPYGETEVSMPLPGRFTVANVLCAVGITLGLGIPFQEITKSIRKLRPVEGRMEPVDLGQPYSIIVDFAHTPDALQQVYSTLRPMVKGRLIAVLGSMGDRDKTKRPILGALAARYADFVIVTNEDPATEDPASIINEVAGGIPRGRPNAEEAKKGENHWWWKIPDRREAISKAIGMAEKGDTVLITGKGGEHVMLIGEKLIPWNDVKVVREILEQMNSQK